MPLPPNESAKVAPEFFVRDLEVSVRYYEALGFGVLRREEGFAVLALGEALLMLDTTERAGAKAANKGAGLNIRLLVDDADEMRRRAVEAGGRIVFEIGDRDYGLRDVIVADPDGFCLRFAKVL